MFFTELFQTQQQSSNVDHTDSTTNPASAIQAGENVRSEEINTQTMQPPNALTTQASILENTSPATPSLVEDK